MDVKQYTMMAVGLIVGVLLISGVVAPVIANVSSDDGDSSSSDPVTYTNSAGDAYYSIAGSSSSMTYYPVELGKWSLESSSVADREVYDSRLIFIGEGVTVGANPVLISNIPTFRVSHGEESYSAMSVSLNGTTLSFLDTNSNQTVSIPNIVYYADPNGDYVDTRDHYSASLTSAYATSESRIVYAIELSTYPDYLITIFGTVGNNEVSIEKYDGESVIDSISDSAVFTIVDGELSTFALTINGSEYVYDVNLNEDDGFIDICLLPVTVTEGSGGGSGLSPTLKTMLSVIPLILTVGLVIGAIGFLRMKN